MGGGTCKTITKKKKKFSKLQHVIRMSPQERNFTAVIVVREVE